ncbi:uncharacterized protein LOC131320090 [Rhododendron vialii]|uniref:uncharacterized protein LOC131320090 n=1 Tax=Rhododendron vialii TaxID=182163 RepID=UPI00265E3555|nr:uncharacterized protein LOC131320090 [Rhododendron vialii]
MASTLIPPRNFIGQNFEQTLNQSIQDLLDSRTRDFSDFSSNFFELMQARANPPLETIWVYSALSFNRTNLPKDEIFDRVSAAKDLFQSVAGFSASCSSSKSIVLLAPVVYEVCILVADLEGKEELGAKREKKVVREIKSLVDAVLGNISVCCSANGDDGGGDFCRPFEELVRVWIGQDIEAKEVFKLFFPLLGDEIVRRLSVEGSSVSEVAGVVIAEAFLLKLCLDFRWGDSEPGLEKELRNWAVGSITGFRNFYFFDTLVRILLEQTLPVNSLLSSEDEVSVRKVIYDAVILAEYSFLNLNKLVDLPAKRVTNLAIARVLVTHEATELFRRKGDQTKAISYINAFSGSTLPTQLVKLVSNEIGMGSKAGQPRGLSPRALMKWLLNLEDQGFRLLDEGIAQYKSRLTFDILEAEHEQLAYNRRGTKTDADLGFFIDNKGEDGSENDERTKESMNAAFVKAAHTMTSAENGGGRKRKGGRSGGKKKHIKFLKYNLHNDSGASGENLAFLRNHEVSTGSEVVDPLSDEDID